MIHEKSCGAVVYKFDGDKLLILLEKMKKGHISIPKGHVEHGETEEQTALREIKEETNLDVILDMNFRHTINYSPYKNCEKDVIFFIATPISDDMVNQECEVSALKWAEYNDAVKMLTHDSDKQTVLLAAEYIMKKHSK